MGGWVKLLISGGAPLSSDTHEIIKLCLCVIVMQEYGDSHARQKWLHKLYNCEFLKV